MRALYLIRHGRPDVPDGEKICLGRMDLPLSFQGKDQAEKLAGRLCLPKNAVVISSPLSRCVETAERAGFQNFFVDHDFTEVDTGEWDGLSFEEIKRRWPDEYEARGMDLYHTAPPKGESFSECERRADTALRRWLKKEKNSDLVLVTHQGVIRTLCRYLTGSDPDEALKMRCGYAQVTAFLIKEEQRIYGPLLSTENDKTPVPDEETCMKLFQKYRTPKKVQAHSQAVASAADEMCASLQEKGIFLNPELVHAAALLHDIARVNRNHEQIGAEWLFSEGYPSVASIVYDHMNLPAEETRISEKSLVFLADKYIKDTAKVTLRERYLEGKPPEFLNFAKKKLKRAKAVERIYQDALRQEEKR